MDRPVQRRSEEKVGRSEEEEDEDMEAREEGMMLETE